MVRSTKSVFFVGLCLIAASPLLYSPVRVSAAPQRVPPAASGGDSARVVVSGHLSRSVVRVGESVGFTLTIHNEKPESVLDVRSIPLDSPGFEVAQLSWYRADARSCFSTLSSAPAQTAPSPDCTLITKELKASQSIAAWGQLRALEPREAETLSAVVGWTTPNGIPSQVAVALGSVAVPSILQVIGRWLTGAVLIGVFGFILQWWLKKRDEKRQEREREITQVNRTWNTMLPQSHRLAMRHYMPLHAAADGVLVYLREYKSLKANASASELREKGRWAFFYCALLARRMRRLSGFYFKDRVGERLASRCYENFQKFAFLLNDDTAQAFSGLLDDVDVNETIGKFSGKLDAALVGGTLPAFKRAWELFDSWLASEKCTTALRYLKAFGCVIGYEMNRPYEYWYGRQPKLELDEESNSVLRSLGSEIAGDPGCTNFVDDLQRYLKEAGVEPTSRR